MVLEVASVVIEQAQLGTRNRFENGLLEIDVDGLRHAVMTSSPAVTAVRVHIARPGDSTRIHCCKDVLQPALRHDDHPYGNGQSRQLENLAVVTCGPIVGFQEGIIDMSGPGASYSPFSNLLLLALEVSVDDQTQPHAHEALLREAGLIASGYLCRICIDVPPSYRREVHWNEKDVDPKLPRIAYVCMVLSQGLLHDTWILGRNAREGLPRLLDPRAVLDGGIVSGNCVSACDKNTTYHHRNNPVLKRLLDGHGKQWNFAGLVVTNQPIRLSDKERSAKEAVALVQQLAPAGAIITKEGFGNPDSDFMMIFKLLKESSIHCVGVTDEFAGSDGASQSLADATPEADMIVSTGNANERIYLPPMTQTIGPVPDVARLAGGYAGSIKPDGALEVELQAIIGATNELGSGYLSAREI